MSRRRGRRFFGGGRTVVKYVKRGRYFAQKWTNKKFLGIKLKWWFLGLVSVIGVLGVSIYGISKALDIKPKAAVKFGLEKAKGK